MTDMETAKAAIKASKREPNYVEQHAPKTIEELRERRRRVMAGPCGDMIRFTRAKRFYPMTTSGVSSSLHGLFLTEQEEDQRAVWIQRGRKPRQRRRVEPKSRPGVH